MEVFEKELPCGAMRDFAEWCRCKASETDGEGSVLKYMTEPESRRQRSRCAAMQTSSKKPGHDAGVGAKKSRVHDGVDPCVYPV